MQNARATGYSIVASRNPGMDFSIYMIPWDRINSLEANANQQINTGWHAQAVIKGNYFNQTFDESNFSRYSSVILSQQEFDKYKDTGEQWWIVCSNLPPFSEIVKFNNNVGIGTDSPETKFQVSNGVITAGSSTATLGTLQFAGDYANDNILNTYGSQFSSGATSIGYAVKQKSGYSGIVSSAGNAAFKKGMLIIDNELEFLSAPASIISIDEDANLTSRFIINQYGNVGIGTTNPQSKLAVNGTITSKEVKVTVDGWSDFVFNSDYKLKDLEEVETFIEENKHLPDVPSEKEVMENGIALGEMDAKLLQKIEELTLYMIEMNKSVKLLQEKNSKLENEIKTLKTQ